MMASTDRTTSFLRPAPSRPRLEPLEPRLAQPTSSSWRKASSRRAGTPDLCCACASIGAPVTARRQAGVKNGSSIGARATAPRLVRTTDCDRGLQIDFRCGDIAAAHFQSLAWRRALTKILTAPGPRSLRYQAPLPRQCTEATIALPHQAPCCSKTFPVTRGKLGAARELWSRIMIAFSCPASEHVSWHNLC